MAGITATSASASVSSPSADNTASGYVTGERITLGTTPAASSSYQWGQAAPSASALARSAVDNDTAAAPTFVPDVAGTYVVTCLVDGATTYTLRLTVQSVSIAEPVEAVRFSPRADTTIPAPAAGVTMYYSSTHSALVVKDSSNVVKPVTLGSAY